MSAADRTDLLRTAELRGRDRYQLLTSLVVPRPIAWVSTRSAAGAANLAPFSYFAALSPTPMLVGVSIGERRGAIKDSLRNIRETGVFCVNIVAQPWLEAMNATSGDYPADVDEFEVAGLAAVDAETVPAPYVEGCPAVLECRLFKEVELEGAANHLVIGEVLAVRTARSLERVAGTSFVRTESLRPVGRLWGGNYALLGETRDIPRPAVGEAGAG